MTERQLVQWNPLCQMPLLPSYKLLCRHHPTAAHRKFIECHYPTKSFIFEHLLTQQLNDNCKGRCHSFRICEENAKYVESCQINFLEATNALTERKICLESKRRLSLTLLTAKTDNFQSNNFVLYLQPECLSASNKVLWRANWFTIPMSSGVNSSPS